MYKKLVIALALIVLILGLFIFLRPNKYESVKVGEQIDVVVERLGEPNTNFNIGPDGVEINIFIWRDIESYEFSSTYPFYEVIYSENSFFMLTEENGLVSKKNYIKDVQEYLKGMENKYLEDQKE